MFLLVCLVLGTGIGVGVPKLLTRQSDSLPPDVLRKIEIDYGYFAKGDEAQEILQSRAGRGGLNVPLLQFVRASLVIADGDLDELRELIEIREDPRDTLVHAEKLNGNPGDYCSQPFKFD